MSRQQRRFEARKGVREPGFTAVPNGRHNARRAATVLALIAAGYPAAAAEQQAWSNLAKSLPRGSMVFNWRAGLPTKNNNPAYRKSIWRASKIALRAVSS